MQLRPILLAAAALLPLLAMPAVAETVDSQTLALAKDLVAKTGGDREQTLASMAAPMVGFMQQMGIDDPTKARALVDEAIMPLLREHYDELMSIQAASYAAALTPEDMKATLAFYNTKAGQDLIRAQPQLTQARMTGLTKWMGTLQPEMQARVQKIAKSHGWTVQ